MSDETKIEWADMAWNPWEGCTKVSPGCANCYAAVRNHRFGNDNWGKGKPRRRTSAANWKKPVKWNDEQDIKMTEAEAMGGRHTYRPRVFPSLCDWLDDEVPIEWFVDFLRLVRSHSGSRLVAADQASGELEQARVPRDGQIRGRSRLVAWWLQGWAEGSAGRGVPLKIKHPKGGDPAEWPFDLRVRQFPNGVKTQRTDT